MHNISCKSALARRACRCSDARPPRKADGIPLESGSPPRMRGKAGRSQRGRWDAGITPAYAGKSPASSARSICWQDHPRVCGEKGRIVHVLVSKPGSPPRMRGKAVGRRWTRKMWRITPAYAGKRISEISMVLASWDHPRVCGEKSSRSLMQGVQSGSPPRMRGKGAWISSRTSRQRITPAYAGKRRSHHESTDQGRDHPRVCGEKCLLAG